jgi:hypothetical protein
MSGFVRDFVDAIGKGENLEAETHFANAMAQKVGDALEGKRQELANTFVTHHIPASEEDEG